MLNLSCFNCLSGNAETHSSISNNGDWFCGSQEEAHTGCVGGGGGICWTEFVVQTLPAVDLAV